MRFFLKIGPFKRKALRPVPWAYFDGALHLKIKLLPRYVHSSTGAVSPLYPRSFFRTGASSLPGINALRILHLRIAATRDKGLNRNALVEQINRQPSSHRIFAGLTAQAVVPANSMFSKIKDMAAESRFFRR